MGDITKTTRKCTVCEESKPLDSEHFPRGGRCKTGFDYRCKECERARNKAYRDSYDGKRQRTAARYKREYGITLSAAEALLVGQGGGCAICEKELDWTTFCVDHCHDTGAVRGILCNNCNTGIGMMRDDVELIEAAASYLLNPPALAT